MSVNEFNLELSHEIIGNANNIQTIKQLVLNGATVNYQTVNEGWCILFEVVTLGLEDSLKSIIDLGVNINVTDKRGRNALFWAIFNDNLTMVNKLIEYGINLKNDVYPSMPAIHYAVYKNNIDIVKCLLENGIDINDIDSTNSTALIFAYLYGKDEMIKFLEKNGANMQHMDIFGNTPYILKLKEKKC